MNYMKSKLHQEYTKVIKILIKDKLKNKKIELIILGGSAARGDETKHSDIDINFYTKNRFMPSNPRSFYKYKGKYVEETFIPLESLKIKEIPAETQVLYDKNDIFSGRQPEFNETEARKLFVNKFIESKKYLRLAEKAYELQNYEKATLHLLGTKSLAFILIHALPQRFNLPYPSFRLLDSVKKASKKIGDKRIYADIIKIYEIKTSLSNNKILKLYEKGYKIMGKLSGNFGFYDPIKLKYNLEELKLTFRDYPSVFALRFIINCIVDWSLEGKSTHREKIKTLTKEILGISEFNKEFVKNSLFLSQDFERRIDNVLKNKWL